MKKSQKKDLTVDAVLIMLSHMRVRLTQFRDKTFANVADLAEAAKDVLESLGAEQRRQTVTETPNERTVRYYIAEGLIPRKETYPDQKDGYTYKHLVILVAIKILQSEGLTIAVIKDVIRDRDIYELESLVNDAASRKELAPTRRLVLRPREEPIEYLESLRLDSDPTERPSMRVGHLRDLAPSPSGGRRERLIDGIEEKWTRIVIADGLEVHVREGYRMPRDPKQRFAVSNEVAKLLEQLP